MCVVVIVVVFITCGECHPIVGPGSSYVVAFIFLAIDQDVECIGPCLWVPVDALHEIILIGRRKWVWSAPMRKARVRYHSRALAHTCCSSSSSAVRGSMPSCSKTLRMVPGSSPSAAPHHSKMSI